MKTLKVSAPSNIALIKYMGKTDLQGNRPTNTSFSLSLPHLRTWVELEPLPAASAADKWEPLAGMDDPKLSPAARDRFLKHSAFVKDKLGLQGTFTIRSANDFPSDCGLASSASSFAALTKALHQWSVEGGGKELPAGELAQLSRAGSGSSCRSFFETWALWTPTEVKPVELAFKNPIHQVVVVHSEKKDVSSSEAHKRVTSSALFSGRPERADQRCKELLAAFGAMDWKRIHELCWVEFQDMHALFETSGPPFGYFEPGSVEVLRAVREVWKSQNDGPVVTMDAGPNVHVLWRPEQAMQARVFASTWKVRHQVISSPLEAFA
jgi:diphosphomevalonate decarboxylase